MWMIYKEIDDRRDMKNMREKIKMVKLLNLDNYENGENLIEINFSFKCFKDIIYWVDLSVRI